MSTTLPIPTRVIDGVALPGIGTWVIDPGHAEVAFTGRHFMVTKVRGRCTDVKGEVVIADEMSGSTVNVVIGMASVSSGSDARDDHLRSAGPAHDDRPDPDPAGWGRLPVISHRPHPAVLNERKDPMDSAGSALQATAPAAAEGGRAS